MVATTAEGCTRWEKGSALSSRWLVKRASTPEAELRKSTATKQVGRSFVKPSADEHDRCERGARQAAGFRRPAWQSTATVCVYVCWGSTLRSVSLRSMNHAKCVMLAGSVRSTHLLLHDSRCQALRPQPACSGAPAPSTKNQKLKWAPSKKTTSTRPSRARTKKPAPSPRKWLEMAAGITT